MSHIITALNVCVLLHLQQQSHAMRVCAMPGTFAQQFWHLHGKTKIRISNTHHMTVSDPWNNDVLPRVDIVLRAIPLCY